MEVSTSTVKYTRVLGGSIELYTSQRQTRTGEYPFGRQNHGREIEAAGLVRWRCRLTGLILLTHSPFRDGAIFPLYLPWRGYPELFQENSGFATLPAWYPRAAQSN